ncbi:hypothetical protein K432DRAFT_311070 [Lepidopterella palustris CBS 459.81]|uniref:BZIP transcription factor n=1 Tax=Lepidopterella palustris CBS 459.81 TaxID=1314670 RepID=A0A8E2J9H2_9PEZI|nr:hypothetical protein K432DRAFT_311070 [Lepidopterella palustris CBS 459.81]
MPDVVDGSNDTSNARARQLRKRELDRRCQREARERTKNRIAYLEGLVEDFKRQDTNGQVANLMKQLSDMAKERDMLAKTLKGIESSIQTHKSALQGSDEPLASMSGVGSYRANVSSLGDVADGSTPNCGFPGFETMDDFQAGLLESDSTKACHGNASLSGDASFAEDGTPMLQSWSNLSDSTSPSIHQVWTGKTIPTRDQNEDAIIPRTHAGCECCPAHRTPDRKAPLNLWRFANETLTEPVELSAQVNQIEEALTEDTPIRAMVEGWDAVRRRCGGKLPPSWAKLRRIDETLFPRLGKIERLAILQTMHRLLRYHTDPTPEKFANLPVWHYKRPSQTVAHSYAIDYFSWPGIRERFVFNQHRYCGNIFWHLFCANFHILWPFEFRDCYTRNTTTGQYMISTTFNERITDINAWTMAGDMFKQWPELYSDIPAFNHIPGKVSDKTPFRTVPLASSTPADAARTQGEEDDVPRDTLHTTQTLDYWNSQHAFLQHSAREPDLNASGHCQDFPSWECPPF